MNRECIIKICNQYGINTIDEIKFIRNESRILVEITDNYHQKFYVKGEEAEKDYWEHCCEYATFLKENKIPITAYLKNKENQYITEIEGKIYSVEKENYGEQIEVINDRLMVQLGKWLGKQHGLSLQYKSPFQVATSWSMFGGNASEKIGDYDENELSFLNFKSGYEGHSLFFYIEALYLAKRTKLQSVWKCLPRGAVQGDFCYYNMVLQDSKIAGIYDFNLAGNEVFLNECLAVGIYHSWHVPYEGAFSPSDRFSVFLSAYQKERPLESSEIEVLDDLFSVIRAFRFDRIEDGVTLKNEFDRNKFIRETAEILT